jgi:hypothetical protein
MSATIDRPETIAGPTLVGQIPVIFKVIQSGIAMRGLTSGIIHYEAVKHLLVNRPLYHQTFQPLSPAATDEEDAQDVADARLVLQDPAEGRVSLDDLRHELGF